MWGGHGAQRWIKWVIYFLKQDLVPILSDKNEISDTYKLNSFLNEYGFRQNTDPRSTDPLLTPPLTPYKINGKMKIKKAQNYQWEPIQVHQ